MKFSLLRYVFIIRLQTGRFRTASSDWLGPNICVSGGLHLRGIEKTTAEWQLICIGYNIKKIHKLKLS